MKTEVSVRIKNEDGSLSSTYKEPDVFNLTLSETDENMAELVKKAVLNFKGEPDEIIIKTVTYW